MLRPSLRALLGLAAALAPVRAAPVSPAKGQYAVIFDCGSTGTRLHVFSWDPTKQLRGSGLPVLDAVPGGHLKVKPGISSFEDDPVGAGKSIEPLLALAERTIPAADIGAAHVYLRATAGMRLLPRRKAQKIYQALFDAVVSRGKLAPRRADFGTLSGEDEGVFGWLAVNYLLARGGKIDTLGAVGALDLGGGSTQITMRAPGSADAKHRRVAFPSGEVAVFSRSHLGWGRSAVLGGLTEAEAAACLAKGARSEWSSNNSGLTGSARTRPIVGLGDFAACDEGVRRTLRGFGRGGQPRIPPGMRFVAMSLFFYAEEFARGAGHLPGVPDRFPQPAGAPHSVAELVEASRGLCAEDSTALSRLNGKDPTSTDEAIPWRCFDLAYAARLLGDGYGFAEGDASIEFLGDIGGVEVEWTLGLLIHSLLPDLAAAAARPGSGPRGDATSPDLLGVALLLICAVGAVLLHRHRRARLAGRSHAGHVRVPAGPLHGGMRMTPVRSP